MANEELLGSFFNAVESKAAQSIQAAEGDFQLDGLWHCGKCKTPKQCRVDFLGQIRTPMCLCKCEKERRDKEAEEERRRERNARIAKLRKMGFPESEMAGWTFAADDLTNPKVTKIAQNYVAHFGEMMERGKGLLFYGPVGTGKTFAAASIANALIDKGFPCMVTNFSRLINTISGMYEGKQEYIDGLNRFDLLVIDDLAVERDTEYVNEIVQTIIDSRYRAGLPLIITTNLSSEEIKNPADMRKQRTFSRLLEMCIPVEVKGTDRRRQILKDTFNDYKDLLGIE